ncbi:hypothetical protein MUA41_13020 (plasmid) [Staphylococcus simulans]|uniref:hypothetical protein n=2 Tax=Staphylococcus simulans TaxID=1286 RepID=UPI0021CFE3A5|nr:hypothetical protein [Staphylococcus simulans]UXR39163.1 hypothetical protein MUA41_13020 [Staphylococcus simulans]
MIELEDYLFQKENWMINILQAVGSIGTFIMAILYLISVMIQIRQIKISFIPFLAFDQIIMEQEGKSLNLRNLTETDSDYVNTAFKLQNLGGGTAKNIDIKVHLNENEVIQEKHINILPSDKYYLMPIGKKAFEEFQDTVKNNGYTTNMYINISYYSQISKKQNNTRYRVNIEEFVNLDDKDLYELTFDTIDA